MPNDDKAAMRPICVDQMRKLMRREYRNFSLPQALILADTVGLRLRVTAQ
jgi:hypothetical protein